MQGFVRGQQRSKIYAYDYVLISLRLARDNWNQRLDRLRHIHADVRNSVLRESGKAGEELSTDDVRVDHWCQGVHAKERCLSVQVVRI